jgi:DNA-binding transcriptional LysR family regulator
VLRPVGERSDSSLISRRVGSTSQWVVASPEHLAGRPEPTHPHDLAHHHCIVHHKEGSDDVWWFVDPASEKNEISVNVRGRFSANNAAAVHRAAVAGQGIACLSHLIVGEDVKAGRLQRLMPDFRPRRSPIYIDYPSRRSLPPRVRAVIDFLHQIAKDDPLLWP